MRSWICLVAAMLAVGCGSGPESLEPGAGRETAEVLPERAGVAYVARVDEVLYRGSQPDGDEGGWNELKRLGIHTVINLRLTSDCADEVQGAGLDYYRIPLYAGISSTPPTDEQVKAFFDIVLDPDKQPVFVHCARGKDRTGTMVALYRIEVDGWSNDEAIAEMDAFGYTDYYEDLKRFVAEYEAQGYAK